MRKNLRKKTRFYKMKKILLNNNQERLFTVLMKPLVYLDISDPKTMKKVQKRYSINLNTEGIKEKNDLLKVMDEYQILEEKELLSEIHLLISRFILYFKEKIFFIKNNFIF